MSGSHVSCSKSTIGSTAPAAITESVASLELGRRPCVILNSVRQARIRWSIEPSFSRCTNGLTAPALTTATWMTWYLLPLLYSSKLHEPRIHMPSQFQFVLGARAVRISKSCAHELDFKQHARQLGHVRVCVPEYPLPKNTLEAPPSVGWKVGGIKPLNIFKPRPTAEETLSMYEGRLQNLNISSSPTKAVSCDQLPGSSTSRREVFSFTPSLSWTLENTLSKPVNKIGLQAWAGEVILLYIPAGVSCHFGMATLPFRRTLSFLRSKRLRLPPRPGRLHSDPPERHLWIAPTTRRDSRFSSVSVSLLLGYPRTRNASRASRERKHLRQPLRSQALWSTFEETVGPRRLVIVTTEFALCSRNRNVRFQKTRKNSEIIEVAGPLSQRCEPSGIENKENNSTQNENEGRYPAKGENITVREPKNTRRLWGYKGIRIVVIPGRGTS